MRKALALLTPELFVEALSEIVAEFAYVKEQRDYKNIFNATNVTYGSLPLPATEQLADTASLAEQFVLCFALCCIFAERVPELDQLIDMLEKNQGFRVRRELLDSLRGDVSANDQNNMNLLLAIHRNSIYKTETLPAQIYELAFKAVQIADATNNSRVMAKHTFEWLNAKWIYIWEHQRFLLMRPVFFEKSITEGRIAKVGSWADKVISLLQAILPTMGFSNESQLNGILNDMRKKVS